MTNSLPEDFPRLARQLASLDTKTALELIEKYNEDMRLSQKQLNEEIRKQTIKAIHEL